MNILEFLNDLEQRTAAIKENLNLMNKMFNEPNPSRDVLLGHIAALTREATKPKQGRASSVVKSSWVVVRKLGLKLNLFEKYKGDSELRQQLKDFLSYE